MNHPLIELPKEGVVEAVVMVKMDQGQLIGTIKHLDLPMIEEIEINGIKVIKAVAPIGATVVLLPPKIIRIMYQ